MTETGHSAPSADTDWWSRRPRRSRTDAKVAGVAGGLGAHLGVDPILFRVGFVALTLLGGAGILTYALLWLLLPADGDEVSAGEALIGRGRSSVSPMLAVVLAVVVIAGVTSSFSWGLPFWPAVIIAVIALHVARRQRRGPFRPGTDWEHRFRPPAGHRESWPDDPYRPPRSTHRSGPGLPSDGPGPFDTPAFWETAHPRGGASTGSPPPIWQTPYPRDGASADAPGGHHSAPSAGRADSPQRSDSAPPEPPDGRPQGTVGTSGAVTPPAWDPLGAAPFAWDLPDIDVRPQAAVAEVRPATVIGRVTVGIALLVGSVQVIGLMAGWWSMWWAAISATALTIIAGGLLLQAFRGRPLTLIGPGVLLCVVTLALSLTGLSGTATISSDRWAPTTVAEVRDSYHVATGQAHLDLTGLTLGSGDRVSTEVEVNAGDVRVLLPQGVNVEVACSANAGQITCGDTVSDGIARRDTWIEHDESHVGTIVLDVHVGAGNVAVTRG